MVSINSHFHKVLFKTMSQFERGNFAVSEAICVRSRFSPCWWLRMIQSFKLWHYKTQLSRIAVSLFQWGKACLDSSGKKENSSVTIAGVRIHKTGVTPLAQVGYVMLILKLEDFCCEYVVRMKWQAVQKYFSPLTAHLLCWLTYACMTVCYATEIDWIFIHI